MPKEKTENKLDTNADNYNEPAQTDNSALKSDQAGNAGTHTIQPAKIALAPIAAPPLQANAVGDTPGAQTKPSSFVDTVYQQIASVIGGDSPNQFLCLTIPGQALSAEDFTYDYKNNAPKGPVIEANESRLANKLFDPCRMVGSDNGLTLPYQYRTALDMLTPKLNSKVAKAKNQLRELLMTKYPYDFGDGDDKTYTLQEVFFRLYDEWIEASEKWSEIQNQKKEELRNRYPGTDAENNTKYNDAYLEWYETVAESNLNAINEKMSKVISVFTPNDMKILEGILDSGSGAELEEARQTLLNTQKLTPDGGYVYPVKFNPTNWFELLGTSFTPIDLLQSPGVLSTQLQSLSVRRLNLNARISDIASMIPDAQNIKTLQEKVDSANSTLDEAKNALTTEYGNGISALLDTVFDIAPLFANGAVPKDIIKKLAAKTELSEGKTVKALIASVLNKLTTSASAQQKYVNASQDLADASAKAIEAQNLANLKSLLSPLQEQLAEIDVKIQNIQTQIQLSAVMRPAADDSGTVKDNDITENAVTPSSVPEGYTQIVITADASSLDKATSSSASASVSTHGASFWFCGYSSKSSTSSSAFNEFASTKNTSIQIGMNIAKVGIEREWFNPGVFALTKDMFNVTTLKIAPNPSSPYTSITDERLKDMASGGSVFPCYPVAMVIARDITVKLVSQSEISSDFSDTIEAHASAGGGFLFFSGSSSSTSSSSSTGVHAVSTGNTVTLKFDTPQIIGYYLEATAADKSSYLEDTAGSEQVGYVTISQFVEDYKKMLTAMNPKTKE